MMSRPQEAGDVQTEVSIETGEGTEKSGKKPGFVRRHIWGLTAATTATLGALGILSRPSDGKNHAFAQIDNAMLQLPSTNRITTAVRDTYIVGKSLFGVLPAPTPQQVAAQKKVQAEIAQGVIHRNSQEAFQQLLKQQQENAETARLLKEATGQTVASDANQ